jgi:hypothetical protein
MMSCQEIRELFPEYLGGRLSPEESRDVESHLAACETCRLELAEAKAVWTALGELPDEEPSPVLRGRFYAMLASEKRLASENRNLEGEAGPSLAGRLDGWLRSWWPRRPAVQFGLALLVLVAGLGIGTRLRTAATADGELVQLRREFQQMRQEVALSMLKQDSSSERLRAVSLSSEIERPTPSLVGALLNTLNTDPNTNVRLAAANALMLFSDQPGMPDKLVQSLAAQKSPLVQVALIDLLIGMHERKSLQALKQLIETRDINPDVKKHAEDGLRDLT